MGGCWIAPSSMPTATSYSFSRHHMRFRGIPPWRTAVTREVTRIPTTVRYYGNSTTAGTRDTTGSWNNDEDTTYTIAAATASKAGVRRQARGARTDRSASRCLKAEGFMQEDEVHETTSSRKLSVLDEGTWGETAKELASDSSNSTGVEIQYILRG